MTYAYYFALQYNRNFYDNLFRREDEEQEKIEAELFGEEHQRLCREEEERDFEAAERQFKAQSTF